MKTAGAVWSAVVAATLVFACSSSSDDGDIWAACAFPKQYGK